jgi:hypothetical protein
MQSTCHGGWALVSGSIFQPSADFSDDQLPTKLCRDLTTMRNRQGYIVAAQLSPAKDANISITNEAQADRFAWLSLSHTTPDRFGNGN